MPTLFKNSGPALSECHNHRQSMEAMNSEPCMRECKGTSLTLSRAGGHEAEIRAFRQKIGDAMGVRVEGPLLEPLPHAFYIFAYNEPRQPAVGMIEFFFYEDGFVSHEDAIYNKAYDLSNMGPLHELVHVRSLIVNDQHRGSVFVHLCSAMMEASLASGRRYMTVVTKDDPNNAALRFYQHAGMQRLGTFVFQGDRQALLGADLPSAVRLFNRLRRNQPLVDGAGFVAQLRSLRVG